MFFHLLTVSAAWVACGGVESDPRKPEVDASDTDSNRLMRHVATHRATDVDGLMNLVVDANGAVNTGETPHSSHLMRKSVSNSRGAAPSSGAASPSDSAFGEMVSSHRLDSSTPATGMAHMRTVVSPITRRVADLEEMMNVEVDARGAVNAPTTSHNNQLMRNAVGQPRGAVVPDGSPSSEVGSLMSRGLGKSTVAGFAQRVKAAIGVTDIILMVVIMVVVFFASLAGFIYWQSVDSDSPSPEGESMRKTSSWRGKKSFFGDYKRADRKVEEAGGTGGAPSGSGMRETMSAGERGNIRSPSPSPRAVAAPYADSVTFTTEKSPRARSKTEGSKPK